MQILPDRELLEPACRVCDAQMYKMAGIGERRVPLDPCRFEKLGQHFDSALGEYKSVAFVRLDQQIISHCASSSSVSRSARGSKRLPIPRVSKTNTSLIVDLSPAVSSKRSPLISLTMREPLQTEDLGFGK